MDDLASIELRRLQARLNRLLQEFGGMQFAAFPTLGGWAPAINAYWARDRIIVCVDLAGVERDAIDIQIEPQRVSLRGRRELPEPKPGDCPVEQVLAMEINHGPFERVVALPERVDPKRANAEHRNGMLWITLPLAAA